MVREGAILGEKSGFDDPRTRAFVGKAVNACHGTVSFSHCCHSHCCRTFFAPMSHRTAGIRTFDIRTPVSFALLTLSHCWHSHCWLRTGVVRTFVFRTLVVQAAVRQEFIFVKRRLSLVCSAVVRSSLFCLSFTFRITNLPDATLVGLCKNLVSNLI